MTAFTTEWLYGLLPSVYRELDAVHGYPLRALTDVLAEQGSLVAADIEQLWDDFFIETCRPWVIPYIAELVGNDLLFDAGRVDPSVSAQRLFTDLAGRDLRPPLAARLRTDVGRTIHYRRRKGTAAMLEQLAAEVTGWPAHITEFFQVVARTVPEGSGPAPGAGWIEVRARDSLERLQGPFDSLPHTVDVRSIGPATGWYGIHHVGFFLWRAVSYPIDGSARPSPTASSWRFQVNPLGAPTQLFSAWNPAGKAGRSSEFTVAGPITRGLLRRDLAASHAAGLGSQQSTELYGEEASLSIARLEKPVTPGSTARPVPYDHLTCCSLQPWPENPPAGKVVAVDPETGRLALGSEWVAETAGLQVHFNQGYVANLGGGSYDRRAWIVPDLDAQGKYKVPDFYTLAQAVADWQASASPNAVITITDSATHTLPDLQLKDHGHLVIQSLNGRRPLISPSRGAGAEVTVTVAATATPAHQAALTLSGVVFDGRLALRDSAARLRFLHSTLVPGGGRTEDGEASSTEPSLTVNGGQPGAELNTRLQVETAFSIIGPLVVPAHCAGIWLLDSIIDGVPRTLNADGVPGPAIAGTADGASHAAPLHVERSTVLGHTSTVELDASETIFTGHVDVLRQQAGCMRFSYVPPGSRTPRRFRCQPDETAPGGARVRPGFTSTRYGDYAYGQLGPDCALEIRTGSEDGSEMGALSHVKQTQRESNLRTRLREYLPFGLDAGVIYVT